MPNFSGIWTVTQQMQAKGASTWPATPGAPTIGTATAGINNCASVTFTAPACTGYPAGGITGYRVISTPGCLSNTGASSPVVVSGLTSGTSYTFKAQATNANGYGALSAASNSITATVQTCATFTTPGPFTWVAPTGVTSVAVVAIGGGGGSGFGCYASGGGLGWRNGMSVTPGTSYNITVGAGGIVNGIGGTSCATSIGSVAGYGGGSNGGITGGQFAGAGGGNGGLRGSRGAGGAGGYSGAGGAGGPGGAGSCGGFAGSGGGGGGGGSGSTTNGTTCRQTRWGAGGGTGVYGQGSNGAAGTGGAGAAGGGGGGGSSGTAGATTTNWCNPGIGGNFGGGGGAGARGFNYFCCGFQCVTYVFRAGAGGAVRIVWAGGSRGTPAFPSTCVGP